MRKTFYLLTFRTLLIVGLVMNIFLLVGLTYASCERLKQKLTDIGRHLLLIFITFVPRKLALATNSVYEFKEQWASNIEIEYYIMSYYYGFFIHLIWSQFPCNSNICYFSKSVVRKHCISVILIVSGMSFFTYSRLKNRKQIIG